LHRLLKVDVITKLLEDGLELLSRRIGTVGIKLEGLERAGLADGNELGDLVLSLLDNLELFSAELISSGLILLGVLKRSLRDLSALNGFVVVVHGGLVSALLLVVGNTQSACLVGSLGSDDLGVILGLSSLHSLTGSLLQSFDFVQDAELHRLLKVDVITKLLEDGLELLSRRIGTVGIKLEGLERAGLADGNELGDLVLSLLDNLELFSAELISSGLILLGVLKRSLRDLSALNGFVVVVHGGLVSALLVVVDNTQSACLLLLNLDLSLVLLVLLVDGLTGLGHVREHRGGLSTLTLDVVDGVSVDRAVEVRLHLLEKSDDLRLGEDTHGAVSWALFDNLLDLLLDLGQTGKLLGADLVVLGVLLLALVLEGLLSVKALMCSLHVRLGGVHAVLGLLLLLLLHDNLGSVLINLLLVLLLLLLDVGDDVVQGLEQILRVAVDVLLLHVLSDWDGRDHGHGEGQKNANSLHIACG